MQVDGIQKGQKVVIVDDLLATGGKELIFHKEYIWSK